MKILSRSLSWLVTLLVPLVLTFLGFRLVLTHAFLDVEYRIPGFPPDEYGFTLQDRLHWSKISWDYLLNGSSISFLGDLTFPDGAPLFNERELSHMQDVKRVIQPALWTGYAGCFLALALGAWAYLGGWRREYLAGVRRGGWLTVGIIAIIGLFAAISFWQFFTLVHKLFFTGDTWLFFTSDTLIRLFPLLFWEVAFLFPIALDLLGGLALGLGLRLKAK